MNKPPTFRQLLLRPEAPIGTFCGLGSIDAIEIACHAGYDFVVIDAQHGAFGLDEMRHAVRAVDAMGGCAVARLPAHDGSMVEPLLDAGYTTLIAPMVNSRESARALVRAACYPPAGLRSQSSCRASLRDGPGYRERIARDLVLLVMIEHIDAVEQCEQILAEPGISGCLIGTTDLQSSLRDAEDVPARIERAIAHTRRIARAAGKPLGIAAASIESARRSADEGDAFVVHATDRRLLQQAMTETMRQWRAGNRRDQSIDTTAVGARH